MHRAIVVLTNSDAADAATAISDKLRDVVLENVSPVDRARRREARRIFEGLRQGKLDRTLFTENANDYFTPETVHDISQGIAPLGPVKSFELTETGARGGIAGGRRPSAARAGVGRCGVPAARVAHRHLCAPVVRGRSDGWPAPPARSARVYPCQG